VCLAFAWLQNFAWANQYPGQSPWQGPPPGPWNFKPSNQQRQTRIPSQNQRPLSPYRSGWLPQQRPSQSPQNYYTNEDTPYIETELSTNTPYVQQSIMLKLSVISNNNLLTATPQTPQTNNLLFQLIDGPVTYSRTLKGKRKIVNDFYYEVTALKPGAILIPPFSVSGEEQTSGYRSNRAFEATMSDSLKLDVRDTNPTSRPWLPLEQLTLKVKLAKDVKPAAGRPLPFTIELTAIGIAGDQLPSLEQQLNTDAFRVYRDRSQVTTILDKKANRMVGRRVETFTLVPQYGGDLKLPQLSINWWNTRNGIAQRASVPLHPIAVSGTRKVTSLFRSDEERSLFPSGTSSAFWIPLAMAFGVIFGYWLAIWFAHRRKGTDQVSPLQPLIVFFQSPMRRLAPAFSPLRDKLRTTTTLLNPVARWHRWRRKLVGALPLSVRFWFCVRFVDEESDPEIWGYTLRFLANKHMSLPLNAPFSVIGSHIIAFHPKAEAEKIHALIHELEQAIYGRKELDFEYWKEAFKHEIRPSLKLWPSKCSGKSISGKTFLPSLNPDRTIKGRS
jgi:hypothetical protein